jgi:hypothetical protein
VEDAKIPAKRVTALLGYGVLGHMTAVAVAVVTGLFIGCAYHPIDNSIARLR